MNSHSVAIGLSCILSCTVSFVALSTAESQAGGLVTVADEAHLRAALIGGGTVTFAVDGTIALSGTLAITNDTALDANGHSLLLDGGGAVRLFLVGTNVALSLRELVLANGRNLGTNGVLGGSGLDACGAGILNLGGTVTLNGCRLNGHRAQGGDGGTGANPGIVDGGAGFGAAICSFGGALNLTNCTLAANVSQGGAGVSSFLSPQPGNGGAALGPAIYANGATVFLDHATVVNNRALGGAAPVFQGIAAGGGGIGAGGGVYATNGTLVISISAFVSNSVAGGSLVATGAIGGGPGSGQGLGGGIFVSAGSSAGISLSSFTSNSATGGAGYRYAPAGQASGGALFSAGTLQLSDCSFWQNQSFGGDLSFWPGIAQGGAVWSTNGVVIVRCKFAENFAVGGDGGGGVPGTTYGAVGEGGALWSSGSAFATNSTFTRNWVSGGSGGGPIPGPAGTGTGGAVLVAAGVASLVNVTIASNFAADGPPPSYPSGPAQGGGLATRNSVVTVHNTIIANSTGGGDVWGTIIDGGHNICSDSTAVFSAPGSLNNTDPKLGPLGDYGGPTQTMPPLMGSPAIDGGDSMNCPPTDQRGHARPFGPACDIGAYESSPPFILGGRVSGYNFADPVMVSAGSSSSSSSNGGIYLLAGIPAGPVTVTPAAEGYLFVPQNRSFMAGPDRWDVDFTAYPWDSVSVDAASVSTLYLAYASRAGGEHWVLLSTNLATWTPIYTNVTGPSNLFEFIDPDVTNQGPRFYRVYNP